jgi:hypothetical protein
MAKTTGFGNKFPLPIGEPVFINKPSPSEKAVLEKIGWKEGDPIPQQLADVIDEIKAEVQEENLPPPVPLTTPPLQIPEIKTLDSLPADKRKEFENVFATMLAQAKDAMAQNEAAKKEAAEFFVENAAPGVNEAIAKARQATVGKLQIVDDRKSKEEEKTTSEVETKQSPKHCEHCGWPYSEKSTVEPTEDDKDAFVQAILGGKAFQKSYSLYNGKLIFVLRTLTPACIDEVFAAVRKAATNSNVETLMEARELRARYMAAAMLVAVQRGNERFGCEVHAPIQERFEEIITSVLPSEVLLRHLITVATEFRQLVDKLEVNAQNPDFY